MQATQQDELITTEYFGTKIQVGIQDSKEEETQESRDPDEKALHSLGYNGKFKRKFTLWSIFSLSFSAIGLLPSVAASLQYSLGYAGIAGMVWGWLIASIMTQFVAISIAELCSCLPTAGGLYYASFVLAPSGWGPLAAWTTGWSNFVAWSSAPASINFSCAYLILFAVSITNPGYHPQGWHTFGLTSVLLVADAVLASLPTIFLAWWNQTEMIFNILSLLIFCIVVPAACIRNPKFNKSELVWGTLQNGTDWPPGLSVMMTFIAVIFTVSGYDASFHVAEETSNAAISGPRAAVSTSCLASIWGWFLVLVIGYTVGDVTEIMEVANNSSEPIMGTYLQQVLGQSGVLAILSLVIISSFFAGVSNMIIGSRINYAYARDNVLPGSFIWSRVHPLTKTPVFAVWLNCGVGILLNSLIFAGPVAIGAIFSIFSIAQYVSYLIPITLRILSRGSRLHNGPWNVGKFSLPCGILSVAWLLLNIPLLCFPVVNGSHLDVNSMNWTCAVYGGTMSLALGWYALHARRWFKGPKVTHETIYSIVNETLNREVTRDLDEGVGK